MQQSKSKHGSALALGAAAGVAGTLVMMAMRSFDEKYAPDTIEKTAEDPGAFVVKTLERATGALPGPVEQSAAMATHLGYGTTFGLLYALWRGRGKKRSSLADGAALGTLVYAFSHLGLLPLVGLEKPTWKHSFAEIGGELFRHIVYGIATAAAFGKSDELL